MIKTSSVNKIKEVIASLKKDMDNIDIEEIVSQYEQLEAVESIAQSIGRNHYEVQKVLLALQLRRKKKHIFNYYINKFYKDEQKTKSQCGYRKSKQRN